jgi:hypothetical protein
MKSQLEDEPKTNIQNKYIMLNFVIKIHCNIIEEKSR